MAKGNFMSIKGGKITYGEGAYSVPAAESAPERPAVRLAEPPPSPVPSVEVLQQSMEEASRLVDDVVLKNYLSSLNEMELLPPDESICQLSELRLFRVTRMVYQKEEYTAFKLASVLNAVQNLNCGVVLVMDGRGDRTDFYLGIRKYDDQRTAHSLKNTLRSALQGQFPGVRTEDLMEDETEALLTDIRENKAKAIASVSCVANSKDENIRENDKFIQGLEKLALALQGQRYTAILLAKSTPQEQLSQVRAAYESIYTQLSPFANLQLSYGTNHALSVSNAFSQGHSSSQTQGTSSSHTENQSESSGTSTNSGVSKPDTKAAFAKGIGSGLLSVASVVTAPLTKGLGYAVAGAIGLAQFGLDKVQISTATSGSGSSHSVTTGDADTTGTNESATESDSENYTTTDGTTRGVSDNMQLTMQNKMLSNTLERIDRQIQRINEFESLGMWESAAYFLSDNQETAEMAAGTYKALMRGENSGVETSAINLWNFHDRDKLPMLRTYLTNFLHPQFLYRTAHSEMNVTAASLVSGNELAIQMSLPRKSVCGFPVVEHADFGKEVVRDVESEGAGSVEIGKIYNMGCAGGVSVRLDRESLAMHTFITGSTGSGKSNTVYEMLRQLETMGVGFLVIEPAKGEYKNVFGHDPGVSVYGTNPQFTKLLRINPFRFPEGVHVLEHVDRLIEIFNVCWPMYAAMPAVLKEAVLQAYEVCGWDLRQSTNRYGSDLFPTFKDLLAELIDVVDRSSYDQEVKSNYKGSLETRIRSLTNGLNGQIFSQSEIDNHILFDSSVIVDLSRVGSLETKALIMGVLVTRLSEYRMTTAEEMNVPLRHITVLEEAHNILKRTGGEGGPEGANLAGKSVEMLSNAIAEMRTYGEGFIIADQSPGAVDLSAIRNTNTKIILRLPDEADRSLAGKSAALRGPQLDEIARLPKGVAVIYQNDWLEPVLCQITRFGGQEELYRHGEAESAGDLRSRFTNDALGLLQRRDVPTEVLDAAVTRMKKALPYVDLPTKTRIALQGVVREYEQDGKISLWEEANFGQLPPLVAEIVDVRGKVERAVHEARSPEELTEALCAILSQAGVEDEDMRFRFAADLVVADYRKRTVEQSSVRKCEDWKMYIMRGGWR